MANTFVKIIYIKIFRISLLAALAMGALLLTVSCSKTNPLETIKIGAIIPLSGPASQHVVFVEAMELAIEEINSTGGINGRKLEMITEDSKTDPEEGKKAFEQIEKDQRPLLFVSTTSVVSLALAPLAEKSKVVLTGMAVANPTLTDNRQWVFKYYVSPKHEAKPILDILKQLKIKKLASLYQDDAFGSSHHLAIKTSFEQNSGTVTSIPFQAKSPKFAANIKNILNQEAVYISGFVKVVGKAVTELRSNNFGGIILTHSGATSLLSNSQPDLKTKLNDVYLAAPIIYNPDYAYARQAKEKYEAKYDNDFTHQAANGYDFIKILASLLNGHELTRNNVRKLLNSC